VSRAPVQRQLRLVEVGLRDGLQAVPRVLDTSTKVQIVERLISAGVREIEVASFAHPAVLPQLADAADVLAAVPRTDGVVYRALVPNLRGAQRAADTAVDVVVALVSCDEKVSRINQGRSVEDVLRELPHIGAVARESGKEFVVGIAMAFFAPCAGLTSAEVRETVADRCVEAGARGVYFADTVGMADPVQITSALRETRARHADLEIGLHLHARNGFALANAYAALQTGVDWLESAFCGLGGDMWFPGTPDVLGNLATEDLLALTSAINVETGIDSGAYEAVSLAAAQATGAPRRDHVGRGGSRGQLAAMSWNEIMSRFEGVTTVSG